MEAEDKDKLKLFVKALRKKVGTHYAGRVLAVSTKKDLVRMINFGESRNFDNDAIVLMVMNFFFPPKLSFTIDLVGGFEDENEVNLLAVHLMKAINEVLSTPIDEAHITSLFPMFSSHLMYRENKHEHEEDESDYVDEEDEKVVEAPKKDDWYDNWSNLYENS